MYKKQCELKIRNKFNKKLNVKNEIDSRLHDKIMPFGKLNFGYYHFHMCRDSDSHNLQRLYFDFNTRKTSMTNQIFEKIHYRGIGKLYVKKDTA